MKQESKIPRKTIVAYKQKQDLRNGGAWWGLEKDALAMELFTTFQKIEKNHTYRRQLNMNLERMYLGFSPVFFSSVYQNATRPEILGQKTVLNVAKSCVDTAVSKLGTMKARPFFLTNGGTQPQKSRAQKLTDFFDGLCMQIGFYDKNKASFKDGCISQAGFTKYFINPVTKKIDCERVFPDEIMVDDIDAIYGTPGTLYQAKMIDRESAKKAYPKFEKQIAACQQVGVQNVGATSIADNIWIIEGWHLRSSANNHDGRHVICIENATIFDEEWKKDYFPFVQHGWAKRPKGYWYTSIVEEVAGIQLDVNVTIAKIQESHKMVAVPHVWLDEASGVNPDHLTNDIGGIGWFRGQPPIFSTPLACNPEIYNHLQAQIMRAYEMVGISQLSAQSQKPSGLNSGVALRTYQDVGSERFKEQGERYEQRQMDGIDILFDLCEELAESGEKLEIMTPSKRSVKKIDWKDARMDREDYILQKYPTNLLPTTPEGKRETILDYLNGGLLDKNIALELLDFPDLKDAVNKQTSESKLIDKIVNKILEDGKYQTPEPYYSPALALEKARKAYLLAELDEYPEKNLDLLRNFMTECANLIQVQQQQQMQQMAMANAAAQTQQNLPQPTTNQTLSEGV